MKKLFIVIFVWLFSFFWLGTSALAREETLEGKVTRILEEKQPYQKLEILVTKGSLKDKNITIESGNLPMSNLPKYLVGDELVINYGQDFQGSDNFYITDYVRRSALFWLLAIFVIIAVAVGRWQGMSSLFGLGISFLVIFKFILPKISAGSDPVQIAILGSLIIIPATFLLSHISLIITGILAHTFVEASKLTGFASEEAGFLQAYKPGLINIRGLLLAGIIIGVLGILDDITISQSAIVQQLKAANPKLRAGKLYKKAILPLLLLFIDNPHPYHPYCFAYI